MKAKYCALIMLFGGVLFVLSCSESKSDQYLILQVQEKDQTREIVLNPGEILKIGINERTGEIWVEFLVAEEVKSRLGEVTRNNIANQMIIKTEKETLFSGTIMQPITSGKFAFPVQSLREAERIIKMIGKKPSYHLKLSPEEAELAKRYTQPVNELAEKAIKAGIDGDYEKAIEFGKRAIELNPEDSRLHLQLSYFYYEKGEYRLALDEALKAEKMSRKEDLDRFPGTYLSIAELYATLKELDKAIEYAKKVVSANKDNEHARFVLAQIYEKAGKYDLAIQEYSELYKSENEETGKKALEAIDRLKRQKGEGGISP